jgi:hypothetical protein
MRSIVKFCLALAAFGYSSPGMSEGLPSKDFIKKIKDYSLTVDLEEKISKSIRSDKKIATRLGIKVIEEEAADMQKYVDLMSNFRDLKGKDREFASSLSPCAHAGFFIRALAVQVANENIVYIQKGNNLFLKIKSSDPESPAYIDQLYHEKARQCDLIITRKLRPISIGTNCVETGADCPED